MYDHYMGDGNILGGQSDVNYAECCEQRIVFLPNVITAGKVVIA